MQLEEYYAQQAVHPSRRVLELRKAKANARSISYWEHQISVFALYLMEILIINAQVAQHEADHAAQENSNAL